MILVVKQAHRIWNINQKLKHSEDIYIAKAEEHFKRLKN